MIETQGLIISDKNSMGVFIRGYNARDLNNKKFIKDNLINGKIYSNNINEIIIGYVLANKLNLVVGSKIRLAVPRTDNTIFGNIPRFKNFRSFRNF